MKFQAYFKMTYKLWCLQTRPIIPKMCRLHRFRSAFCFSALFPSFSAAGVASFHLFFPLLMYLHCLFFKRWLEGVTKTKI